MSWDPQRTDLLEGHLGGISGKSKLVKNGHPNVPYVQKVLKILDHVEVMFMSKAKVFVITNS